MNYATDKQRAFMIDLKLPWDQETTFDQARSAISAKVGNVNVPVKEVIPADKPKNAFKGGFDASSSYVSYVKDLCIAILANDKSPSEEYIARAMKLSIQMIKDAKEAFS